MHDKYRIDGSPGLVRASKTLINGTRLETASVSPYIGLSLLHLWTVRKFIDVGVTR